ncbi:MAG TPA: hypothetical protein VHE61_22910 [Opitutaceae bacterium]|nr:hypothetical protein [Opitutaceae bacterium]
MKYQRKTSLILFACMLGLLGYCVHLRAELRESIRRSRQAAPRTEVAMGQEQGLAPRDPHRPESMPVVVTTRDREPAELYARFERFPDKRGLRMMYHVYGDFLMKCGLAPDATEKVAELLVARDAAVKDAQDAAKRAKLGNRYLTDALTDATADFDRQLQSLLTPTQWADLQAVPKVNMFKSAVNASVGVDLAVAGSPLTKGQTEQIAHIWADFQDPKKNPAVYDMANAATSPVTGMTPLHEAILRQSAAVLSREQLRIFRAYLVEQDAPGGVNKRIVRD